MLGYHFLFLQKILLYDSLAPERNSKHEWKTSVQNMKKAQYTPAKLWRENN